MAADFPGLLTPRLVLRPWRDADRAPFAALSADAEVMRFLRPLPTQALSDAWIDNQQAHQAEHGFCFWAVALRDGGAFAGSVGLMRVPYQAHFTPAVELGWRLARPFWGRGLAPEAAAEAMRFAFQDLALPELVANAGVGNGKSHRVMEKLGMRRDPADDFDHPRLAEGDPLRRQVLYRLDRDAWRGRRG